MIRKLGLVIVLIMFFLSPVLAQNMPSSKTSLDSVILNGHKLNKKISFYLEKEYDSGGFRRTTTIKKQQELIDYIGNEIIKKDKDLNVINCKVETWGQPGDLDHLVATIIVECTECPDNMCTLEYTYRVLKDHQEPVQPDKSIKI